MYFDELSVFSFSKCVLCMRCVASETQIITPFDGLKIASIIITIHPMGVVRADLLSEARRKTAMQLRINT